MIETRLLVYFLAVAREQSFTRAARSLYITQPTLSKQMMLLEQELGRPLFVRGKRSVTLTEDGEYLRSQAREMIDLMTRTEDAFRSAETDVTGDVTIGCGETGAMELVTSAFQRVHEDHPLIRFHLFSGDGGAVSERLDRGLVDAGLLLSPVRQERYDYIDLKHEDDFGLLMRRDDPLASRAEIPVSLLRELPLILPSQLAEGSHDLGLSAGSLDPAQAVATYSLIFNATFMVEKGLGLAVCLSGLIDRHNDRGLIFRPLTPRLPVRSFLVTRKYRTFSPAMRLFLDEVRAAVSGA